MKTYHTEANSGGITKQSKFIFQYNFCDSVSISFMKWFHKISVTMNLLIFSKAEFTHLFLYTVNVNDKIHFQ